ncbi:cobalamin B12-binding domain-containing protein [Nocardiopsis alba]
MREVRSLQKSNQLLGTIFEVGSMFGDGATGFRPKSIVSSTVSDSHTWNLIFLQLLLEEMGHEVVNIGSCVPEETLIRECLERRPDLVVVSSVNGHGFNDALGLIRNVRSVPGLERTPFVVGGKLGVDGVRDVGFTRRLLQEGFDAVFGEDDLAGFREFVSARGLRAVS